MAKWSEKSQCIKPKNELWDMDLEFKYVRPVVEQDARALAVPENFYHIIQGLPQYYNDCTQDDKKTIFNLIEDIISANMKSTWMNGDFLTEFVDIKEVSTWET
jgi:hypothetical protein